MRGNPKIPCMKEHKDENATGDTPFLPTSAGSGTCLPCVSTKGDHVCPNVVVLALLFYPGTKPFLPGNLPVPIPVQQHVEKVTS